jgi:hypothetical protein
MNPHFIFLLGILFGACIGVMLPFAASSLLNAIDRIKTRSKIANVNDLKWWESYTEGGIDL